MKLYIIRHGETNWNVEKRLQGRTDIPLNENGRNLALKTGVGMKNIPIDVAISSPLMRAKETAELVLKGRNIPVLEDTRLIEISFGEYEGLISSKNGYEIPDPKFQNFFVAPQCYQPPNEGESLESLKKRTAEFMEHLLIHPGFQNKNILVATHGGAMKGLLNSIQDVEIADFWGKGVPKNCGVAILEEKNGSWCILEEEHIYYE